MSFSTKRNTASSLQKVEVLQPAFLHEAGPRKASACENLGPEADSSEEPRLGWAAQWQSGAREPPCKRNVTDADRL